MRAAEALVQAQLNKLPVLPAVAQNLIRSLDDIDVRTDTLAADIAIDPVISGRVLRAANSAYYAPPRPLDTIEQALRYLGFSQIRSIVITSVMQGTWQLPAKEQSDFWARSMRAAIYGKAVAGWINAPGETAYLLGLVHDLGYLVLSMAAPDAMAQIAQDHEGRAQQLVAEQARLDCSSLAVTAALLRIWSFPSTITHALDCDDCHTHQLSTQCAPMGPLAAALHVARSVASGALPTQGASLLALDNLTFETVRDALLEIDTSGIAQLL